MGVGRDFSVARPPFRRHVSDGVPGKIFPFIEAARVPMPLDHVAPERLVRDGRGNGSLDVHGG
jgi:hypothetical protein